jgi:hypothetical protein
MSAPDDNAPLHALAGSSYEILANFPTPGEITRHLVRTGVKAVEIVELEHYWYASYGIGSTA